MRYLLVVSVLRTIDRSWLAPSLGRQTGETILFNAANGGQQKRFFNQLKRFLRFEKYLKLP